MELAKWRGDRPRRTRSRTRLWERQRPQPSGGSERLETCTSFPLLSPVKGISIPKLRPSRLLYLPTCYHLWHYEPKQEKPTGERAWTWVSSESGEGKEKTGKKRVWQRREMVVLGLALPELWKLWSRSLPSTGFVSPPSVDWGWWTRSSLHKVCTNWERHPKWLILGVSRTWNKSCWITWWESHSLSEFQPPFPFHSSQGQSLRPVLIKCAVTLAELPLSTRSQQGLSNVICKESNNFH